MSLQIPVYVSHKEVHALKISRVQFVGFSGNVEDPYQSTSVIMHFEEGEEFSRQASTENRPKPEVGWYFVIYADGYHSFSPAKIFEAGHTLKVVGRENGSASAEGCGRAERA